MSEENHLEKIGEIIKTLSAESSFSADAMRQFMELKDEVDSQERTITYLRGELKERDTEITGMKAEIAARDAHIAELTDEIVGWTTKSNELEARELEATKLEMTAHFSNLRVEDHQTMVGLIFRNTELRERVLGQELSLVPGEVEIRDQYGNIVQSSSGAYYIGAPAEKTTAKTVE